MDEMENDIAKAAGDIVSKEAGSQLGVDVQAALPAIIEALEMLFAHIGAPKPNALAELSAASKSGTNN